MCVFRLELPRALRGHLEPHSCCILPTDDAPFLLKFLQHGKKWLNQGYGFREEGSHCPVCFLSFGESVTPSSSSLLLLVVDLPRTGGLSPSWRIGAFQSINSRDPHCPGQVAQWLRASSQYTEVAGLIPARAHIRINQWMHEYVRQQIDVSLGLSLSPPLPRFFSP